MSNGWDAPGMRSHAWRKLRAEVLEENVLTNAGRCTLATKVCTRVATEVHHTLGIRYTGHDRRYVAAVCRACNLHVGDPMTTPDPPVVHKKWF